MPVKLFRVSATRSVATGGGTDATEGEIPACILRKGGQMATDQARLPRRARVTGASDTLSETVHETLGDAGSDTSSLPARGQVVALLPRSVHQRPSGFYVGVVKPVADRAFGVVALAAATIPMLVVAAVVAIAVGRPVLFRQRRVGRDGRTFDVFKFRTMRADRRSVALDVIHDRRATHKSDDDPRHTRVGRLLRRYSIDELPQLFNVVRGDMSIVGPRPELVSVVERYPAGLHRRHHVKPGLTGLWQVSARGGGPMHENGQWDLAYVDSISLRTDLSIIARTPKAMVGANAGS